MTDNSTVLASVFLAGTTDFQQRVPDPSQHSVAQVSEFLFKPMNKRYLNEFMDIFVNRIAGEVIRQRTFTNPLKRKREDIAFGTTLEEIELDFIKAHAFKDDWGSRVDDIYNLLKVHRPKGQVAYHSVNRYDTYEISINRTELRGAFTRENGLNELAQKIMRVPFNSAEYDEYQYYKQIMAEHEARHGFYKHQIAKPYNDTTGKAFLRVLRQYADQFTVPTKLYNALDADIPVWVDPGEISNMVLYIEAGPKASLDVDTLSSVFQLNKAEAPYRIQFVDSIPIPGAYALLTTDDFFVCADYDISNDSFFNPQTRTETWYYTVMGMYSASPFVPAVLFTTGSGTSVPTITETVSGLTLVPNSGEIEQGGQLALVTTLAGTLSASAGAVPQILSVAPDSVTYEVMTNEIEYTGAGAYTITVGGTVAEGDKITIAGVEITLDETSAANATAAATAMVTALSAESDVTDLYTINRSAGAITFTEKSGHYGVGMPTYSITSTAGTLTAATTTEPSNTVTNNSLGIDTYVDRFGILHVGSTVAVGTNIVVKVTSTYDDGTNDPETATGTFTVIAAS